MTISGERLIAPYTDLGNLLLLDTAPIEESDNITSERLVELTALNAQHLFGEVWKLPRKIVQDATCAQLPECNYDLPREKSLPKPREPTKWEKFAKSKGIVKQKRNKKVWDDPSQDWKPRYGYRRASNDGGEGKKNWLIEIPDQKDPYVDYFAEKSKEKLEQKSKQELQRLKNLGRQTNSSQQMNGDGTQFSGGGRNPIKQLGPVKNAKKSKEQLIHQIYRAKEATASVGKFQQALKGEVKPKGTGERRKFDPNEGKENLVSERERQMKILEGLQAKKPKLVENRVNAVGEHIRRTTKWKSEDDFKGSSKKRSGGATRPKSQIDRQQKFDRFKKHVKKGKNEPNSRAGMKRKRATK